MQSTSVVFVNRQSIRDKLAKYLDRDEIKAKMNDAVASSVVESGVVESVGRRFSDTLLQSIFACEGDNFKVGQLGETAIDAVADIDYGNVKVLPNGEYSVDVWFSGDKTRPSLVPDEYDGVRNIAALLNNGYPLDEHRMGVVSGDWHGKRIKSLPKRQGAHFVEDAIRKFEAEYGGKCHVIANEIYDIK